MSVATGLQVMAAMMEAEVTRLAGPRGKPIKSALNGRGGGVKVWPPRTGGQTFTCSVSRANRMSGALARVVHHRRPNKAAFVRNPFGSGQDPRLPNTAGTYLRR